MTAEDVREKALVYVLRIIKGLLLGGALMVASDGVAFGQQFSSALAGSAVVLSGGIGTMGIRADEYVLLGNRKISQLTWESSFVPVFSGALDLRLPESWTLKVSGAAGLGGDSHMTDTDWDPIFSASDDPTDWSDRSIHSDTDLDHYFNARLALGRDVAIADGVKVNFHGGVKYTDVKWSASGGSYVYSDTTYRDTVGNFPQGMPAVTYRQQLPVGFAGLDAEMVSGRWTFGGSAELGMLAFGGTHDNHWTDGRRYVDYLDLAPSLSLEAKAAYAIDDSLSAFASLAYDQIFLARADTDFVSPADPATNGLYLDQGGTEYAAVSVSGGLKGKF
jgi:outer membrane protease